MQIFRRKTVKPGEGATEILKLAEFAHGTVAANLVMWAAMRRILPNRNRALHVVEGAIGFDCGTISP